MPIRVRIKVMVRVRLPTGVLICLVVITQPFGIEGTVFPCIGGVANGGGAISHFSA